MGEFVNKSRACHCPPACQESSYPAVASTAQWAAKKFEVNWETS
jgi:hypothetical protein